MIESIYAPENFFRRVLSVGTQLDLSQRRFRPTRLKRFVHIRSLFRLIWAMGRQRRTRRQFWKVFFTALFDKRASFTVTLSIASMYLHMGPFAEQIAARTREVLREEARRGGERSDPYTRRAALTGS